MLFTLVCAGITVVLFFIPKAAYTSEVFFGWSLGFVNHLLDTLLLLHLDRLPIEKRLKHWLVLTAIKFSALLGIMAMFFLQSSYQPIPLVCAFFIAYFLFFLYHVAKLSKKFLA